MSTHRLQALREVAVPAPTLEARQSDRKTRLCLTPGPWRAWPGLQVDQPGHVVFRGKRCLTATASPGCLCGLCC